MDRKMVNFIKEQYPPGTRIRLNSMEDPYHPILPGTEGEVDFVDNEGQIFMKWDNGRTLPLAPGEDSFTVLPPKLTTLKLYMPLTADLYERNEYGDLDDSSTLLEGSELRGYQDQITAALVKNRMPEETERGIMHWYDEADSVDRKVRSAVFTVEKHSSGSPSASLGEKSSCSVWMLHSSEFQKWTYNSPPSSTEISRCSKPSHQPSEACPVINSFKVSISVSDNSPATRHSATPQSCRSRFSTAKTAERTLRSTLSGLWYQCMMPRSVSSGIRFFTSAAVI